jgi:hypothetical protein
MLSIYLGLRLGANLHWASHVNYIISRIRHVRLIRARFAFLFDRSMRIYLRKSLLFPVIGLYDFIYDVGRGDHLARLSVPYNNLMRTVLGVGRSVHVRVSDV